MSFGALVRATQDRDLVEFIRQITFKFEIVTEKKDGLNIYQIASFFGSIEIMEYLDDHGFSYLSDELDDEIPFYF